MTVIDVTGATLKFDGMDAPPFESFDTSPLRLMFTPTPGERLAFLAWIASARGGMTVGQLGEYLRAVAKGKIT